MGYGDLIDAFLKIRSSLGNLSKDVDEKDSREKTDQDLAAVTVNFQDLFTLFKSMEASDMQKIYQEVMELSSGEETFQEYIRDVNKILVDVKRKAQKSDSAKEKLEQNLPRNLKDEGIESLLEKYQETVQQINAWQDQVKNKTVGRK